jgi:hypothetical protein
VAARERQPGCLGTLVLQFILFIFYLFFFIRAQPTTNNWTGESVEVQRTHVAVGFWFLVDDYPNQQFVAF